MAGARAHMRPIAGGVIGLAGLFGFIGSAVFSLLAATGGTMPTLSDSYTLSILRFTLVQASLSTLLSLAFALPVALALARQRQFFGRRWLIRLMALPMGLPVLIGALGLIGIWGHNGLANRLLATLGRETPVSIYGLSGILLAHVFFNMPLATRLLLAGLERVPPDYWRMAASLGMGSGPIFRRVEWPALRGLLPGIAGLIFMLCATSFTLVLTLGGGPGATTLEVAIYQALRFDFDPSRAVSLAALQLAVTATLLALLSLLPSVDDRTIDDNKPILRLDGTPWSARCRDATVLVIASLFLIAPFAEIVIAGLKADLGRLLNDQALWRAMATSLAIAAPAGLVALGLSLLFIRSRTALAALRHGGFAAAGLSRLIGATASLVLLVPAIVLATGWFLLLRRFGSPSPSTAPVVVAAVVVAINAIMALPFTMRVLTPALASHRQRTARLAESLGLAGFAKLRHVDWPGLRRPLLTALSFAMALSLGDLGAVALFGADALVTLPWLIYSRMGSYRTADADGLALVLGLVCLVLTVVGTAGGKERDRS
ncbi:thiamine/thiamine pyrophosphate ABC transporter permease ThiP [Allorhizobium taibaishanense]|uniref:Thiamine transport system permease protein ThiP n=2 Tax=Allorhizobium taibaishanense TaxID=887144 RepID=A0A1Q9A2B0_9HYPH|nr:thiamine/thiamine pyrophosphate ABC transporter permease ThiP [Allorhizobium taibaishanense]OLP48604.1 thiamine/thiamine pyrophosphate ABC transporter permease ThiP [Allorhizobium taibaishanense]